jgi:topoisomerase-4 subunit B
MDEVVAKHATEINVELMEDNTLCISDNGRGIPVDNHPKFKGKSALEVIMTTLHAGGKFSNKNYTTSGGLHGVGASVVNALSIFMIVEVIRSGTIYRQDFSMGLATTTLQNLGNTKKSNGTSITFKPDDKIFGDNIFFSPEKLFKILEYKAYLFGGVQINWKCHASLISENSNIIDEKSLCYKNGLSEYIEFKTASIPMYIGSTFESKVNIDNELIEWAIRWFTQDELNFIESFCNTVPTPLGGTHELGFRQALLKGIKNFAEIKGF